MLIYTCVTHCIFTCNYLWYLNACQWRYGLQTYFRTWITRVSILFNHLIDGYCHLLFICYTLITQYYHNITQLNVKCLHFTRYMTLPNRGPPPSLNHITHCLICQHIIYLVYWVLEDCFFDMCLKSKVKSKRDGKKFDSNYWGNIRRNHYMSLTSLSRIKALSVLISKFQTILCHSLAIIHWCLIIAVPFPKHCVILPMFSWGLISFCLGSSTYYFLDAFMLLFRLLFWKCLF